MAVKIVQGLFILLLTGALSVGSLVASSALQWAQQLPSLEALDALEFSSTSQVFARDGSTRIGVLVPVMGEDRESTNRIPVTSLEDVSPAVLQAIVAYEDDRFFDHYGVDALAVLRATYEEFLGDSSRGGSTITVQVIKNMLLQDIRGERSLERKTKEIMLALELERRLTKSEILQHYVNVVFWGGNVYGIRAAAQAYFGKDPTELNLAEGLYLARLIPAPNSRHDDFATTRISMREVLDKMVRQGTISEQMAERAWLYPLEPLGWDVKYDGQGNIANAERTNADVLVQSSVSSDLSRAVIVAVRNWLTERYGDSRVFGSGGLRVTTTIDVQTQLAANEASLRAEVPEGAQLAIVGIDPASGAVLAMVGQKLQPGVIGGELNRATQAHRQPGSSFKPIVYATAIEQGGFNQATILVDEPASFTVPGQPAYKPDNWDFKYDGYQTVRANMNRSRNIPAVKALEAATPAAVAEKARELGYEVMPYYAMALGSYEVTPLQHTAAMAAFANGGVYTEPYFIERVEDADGNVLYQAAPRTARVWSEQTAYVMLDMMHGNIVDRDPAYGLSNRASVPGRWLAGKTGTTNNDVDIWFVGMTPGLVASVWIGNDSGASLPTRMTLSDGSADTVTSSRQPIYAWNDFVANAMQGKPSGDSFPVPPGIVFQQIDLKSGAPSAGGVRAAFREGDDLLAQGVAKSVKLSLPIDTATGKRATVDTPADRVEIIEVDPQDVNQYLGGSG